jgi:hypothetical protein
MNSAQDSNVSSPMHFIPQLGVLAKLNEQRSEKFKRVSKPIFKIFSQLLTQQKSQ